MDAAVYQFLGYGFIALLWIAASFGLIKTVALVTGHFSSQINAFLNAVENTNRKKQNALRASMHSTGRLNRMVAG